MNCTGKIALFITVFSARLCLADVRLEFADVELNEFDARVVLRATPFEGSEPAGAIDLVAYGVVFEFDQFRNLESATGTIQNVLPNLQELASDPSPAEISELDTFQVVTIASNIINPANEPAAIDALGSDLIELNFTFSEAFEVGQSFRIKTIDRDPARASRQTGFGVPHVLGSIRIINPYPCDVNLDGVCDANDIDFLSDVVRSGHQPTRFDLNNDGLVNNDDREFWIVDLMNTYVGDSDLNGVFGTGDLIAVFSAGEYEDEIVGNSSWATGDWNGDRDFGTPDLIAAFGQAGFEAGPRAAVLAVPEPFGYFPLLLMLVFCRCRRR